MARPGSLQPQQEIKPETSGHCLFAAAIYQKIEEILQIPIGRKPVNSISETGVIYIKSVYRRQFRKVFPWVIKMLFDISGVS